MKPILIPAKNIYQKTFDNSVDNVVKLVQVYTKKYRAAHIPDDVVYSEIFEQEFDIYPQSYSHKFFDVKVKYDFKYVATRTIAYIQPYVFRVENLKIKKDADNQSIVSLEKINFSVLCDVIRGTTSATSIKRGDEDIIEYLSFNRNEQVEKTITEFKNEESVWLNEPVYQLSYIEIPKEVYDTVLEVEEYSDHFLVNFQFVCGTYSYNLKGAKELSSQSDEGVEFDLTGTFEHLKPKRIDVNINGSIIIANFDDVTVSYGDVTSKNVFIVGGGNTLLQEDTYSTSYDYDGSATTHYFIEVFKELLEEYKNGKKILRLVCDIGDYYYYDDSKSNFKGTIAISRNDTKLTFSKYDEVVPMYMLADGRIVPIAKYEDGSPMVFVVIGIRIYYDGVVWQELTLQQK